MRKFDKVLRDGSRIKSIRRDTDEITITEKLDGANASITVELGQDGTPIIRVFSADREVDEKNNLRGFYQFVKSNLEEDLIDWAILQMKVMENCTKVTFYGEWLVPHTVTYLPQWEHNLYVFAVYADNLGGFDTSGYLDYDTVEKMTEWIGMDMVPLLYRGTNLPESELNKYVGKSNMTPIPNRGEGIVITDESNLGSPNSRTKRVNSYFAEKKLHKSKQSDQNLAYSDTFMLEFLTVGRMNKLLNKLVDEGVTTFDEINFDNFNSLKDSLIERLYADILEEEEPDGDQFKVAIALKRVSHEVIPYLRHAITNLEDRRVSQFLEREEIKKTLTNVMTNTDTFDKKQYSLKFDETEK